MELNKEEKVAWKQRTQKLLDKRQAEVIANNSKQFFKSTNISDQQPFLIIMKEKRQHLTCIGERALHGGTKQYCKVNLL